MHQVRLTDLANNKAIRNSFENQSTDFSHPALQAKQLVIWLPKDNLGISDEEISCIRSRYPNIWITNENATMNEKGKVTIHGKPV